MHQFVARSALHAQRLLAPLPVKRVAMRGRNRALADQPKWALGRYVGLHSRSRFPSC